MSRIAAPTRDEGRPIVAIDPGRDKCGLAVVYRSGRVAEQAVVPRADLMDAVTNLDRRYRPEALVIGNRTGSKECRRDLRARGWKAIVTVDEHETTVRARARYFHDNPPRGLRRLMPLGMLLPPRPIDDYAAILLAETYWSAT